MSGPRALSLQGFGVTIGPTCVLSSVTLDIPKTGLVNLMGPAGAGKSTLLRTVAGLNDAHPAISTFGTAMLAGVPLDSIRPPLAGELRPGIGLVHQHSRFFLASVRENLVSALPNRSALDAATQTRLICDLLTRHELGELTSSLSDNVVNLPAEIQRRLAVLRAIIPEPPLLLADEPTAGIDEVAGRKVIDLMRAYAQRRAVLLVTHHQGLARHAGGHVALLAKGAIREFTPTAEFFSSPRSPSGACFIRTGRCGAHGSETCVETSPTLSENPSVQSVAEPQQRPAKSTTAPSHFVGPRGFFWVIPGLLGGLPRPGIVASLEADLDGLVRLGVSMLVTLEEKPTVDTTLLGKLNIASVHFPIQDMEAPSLQEAHRLCERVALELSRGVTVAMHCRAGLGRTGTQLAAQLIFEGETARAAIDRIRAINPHCIQSDAQVQFLSSFEHYRTPTGAGLRSNRPTPSLST